MTGLGVPQVREGASGWGIRIKNTEMTIQCQSQAEDFCQNKVEYMIGEITGKVANEMKWQSFKVSS